jgi:hypothetical protein
MFEETSAEMVLWHQFISSYSEWSIYTQLQFQLFLGGQLASIYNLNGKVINLFKSSVLVKPRLDSGGLVESGANRTELDVGEDNAGVGAVGLKVGRLARGGRASATGNTRLAGVSGGGVARVEPKHVDCVVIPEGHDKDVTASKRCAHTVETTKSSEGVVVAEGSLLVLAEAVSDGVSAGAGDGGLRVLVNFAVLDVEALDLGQAGAGADKLRNDGHLLLGVEGGAGAVEVLHTHAVAVEVAAVLVADALVAVIAVTAVGARASNDTRALAGVGSVCGRDAVSLPDVHLSAAGASGAGTGVGVVGVGDPAGGVGLAVDPLDVVRALGVAVS